MYYSFKSKYRRLCKHEEKIYKQKIHTELSNDMEKNPKNFWNLINKLDKMYTSSESKEALPHADFFHFFKNLNKAHSNNSSFHDNIIHEFEQAMKKLNTNCPQNIHDIFDHNITPDEISKAIKLLKPGKSTSCDMISNEMLKYSGSCILKPLEKLFNFIFKNGTFPRLWNESFLVLIHKSGSKVDPSNYRGISITSNLGKLFNRIIYTRLLTFTNTKSLISENQIGFKENCRTADHLFSIKAIIEHYKSKKNKVFAAFIDLRKAFDTIWRVGLFYKLLKSDIPPKLFQIIFSMYSNTTNRIKFSNGLSKVFQSECGVKQGDVLSPLLFNIFLDDIVKELKKYKCDPVQICNTSVNCLLYADDIVLLSESKSGLQTSLNVINEYCTNWKLHVNVDKSKVVVFNSNGRTHINEFYYNNNVIQTVPKYCYLGIMLHYNGKFNLAVSLLMEKARKAFF